MKKHRASRRGHGAVGAQVSPLVSFEDDDGLTPRAPASRQERLREVLREELDGLLRDDVADPALDDLAVSWVELSSDCRSARVHVATVRRVDPAVIARVLDRATPFLRRSLAGTLDLKFVPLLRFLVTVGVAPSAPRGDECG
jgi:ribosome-binding factor A